MKDNPAPDGAVNPAVVFDGKPVLRFREESERRNFIKVAALVGAGSSLVAMTSRDPKAFAGADAQTNDLEILNYALTLEYLEADFYARGIAGGALTGRYLEIVKTIGNHESTHVLAVRKTIQDLGGKPVSKPQTQYPSGTFTDRKKFLTTASTFEELGVTAYHGQVPRVQSADVLKAAASIAGVESRHAAVIADMLGGKPFPAPFEKSMSMQQVLQAAAPFIKS